jgi:type III secretion protein C
VKQRRHALLVAGLAASLAAVAAAQPLVLETEPVAAARAPQPRASDPLAGSAPPAIVAGPAALEALGGKIPWRSHRFVYKAESKPLAEVLNDFGAAEAVPVVVGDGVEGVVQASFDTSPDNFLTAVSRAYGLLWYYDGAALYFYPARAMRSRLFRLEGYTGEQVKNLLRSLKLLDARYPLRYDETENTLLVYGPPRHVELASAAIESLDAGATARGSSTVRVFPLRFAWASDRQLGGQTVPGMTSVLRGVYGGGTASSVGAVSAAAAQRVGSNAGDALMAKSMALQKTYGMDAIGSAATSLGTSGTTPSPDSITGSAPRGLRSPVESDREAATPTFQADEATNSVIVRGPRTRMDEYAELIQRLDVAPTLVELEATIIDVSDDSLDALGIDWSFQNAKSNVTITSPAGVSGGTATYSIGTLWANAGRQLLANVSALASQGKAHIVSKPRVLGMANRTATMQETRVVSVRVSGNLDSSLYQLEAGTLLNVTPQVVNYGDALRFKLSIYIRDGNFETNQVDQIPVITRTEISTEAQLAEGEGLLIGGIALESDTESMSGIPLLSQIPLLGAAFRWKQTNHSRSERLFLITPRLVRDPELLSRGENGRFPVPVSVPPEVPVTAPAPEPTAVPVSTSTAAH